MKEKHKKTLQTQLESLKSTARNRYKELKKQLNLEKPNRKAVCEVVYMAVMLEIKPKH